MKLPEKLAIYAVAVAAVTAGTANAQDNMDWSSISPYGLEMVGEFGNIHYVDPYADDSQVDIYGNVTSSYNGQMDPTLGMYDLAPAWQDNPYNSGAYSAPSYSAPSFNELNSTAYTMTTSEHYKPGGLYDTTWMFER